MARLETDLLVFAANLGLGGTQRVVTNLANLWTREGLRVTVVTIGERGEAFALDPGVVRVRLDSVPRDASFVRQTAARLRALWLVRGVLRRARARAIISFGDLPNILVLAAALGLSRDIVISERTDPLLHPLGSVWDGLRRLLYRRAWRVTANSEGVLDALSAYVPRAKLFMVHNPILSVPTDAGADVGEPTIVAAGRLAHQKGYDVLLEAFARTTARRRGWQLVVLGDGDLREELRALADRLGISESVRWEGHVPEPMAYMAKAQIFALPSRYEGTPNALLEAMSLGLPPIVTDASSGPLALVDHEETGLVVPVENADALAAALDRLAADQGLRNRLGSAARQRLHRHTPDEVLAEWKVILDGRV